MSELPPDLPRELEYGFVVGRWLLAGADRPLVDENDLPDIYAPEGKVEFKYLDATQTRYDVMQNDGTTVRIAKKPVEVPLDSDGEIHLAHLDSPGIWLVTGQWEVTATVDGVRETPYVVLLTSGYTTEHPFDLHMHNQDNVPPEVPPEEPDPTPIDSVTPEPGPLKFGYVVGRWLLAGADREIGDDDPFPDEYAATGRVVFTYAGESLVREDVSQNDGTTVKISKKPVETTLKSNGELGLEHIETPGVWLVTGVWNVATDIGDVRDAPFDVLVTEAHTLESPLDLHMHAPIVETPTTILVPSIETMQRAEAAADRAESVVESLVDMGIGHAVDAYLGDGSVLAPVIQPIAESVVNSGIQAHVQSETPHPVYDDMQSMILIYNAHKI